MITIICGKQLSRVASKEETATALLVVAAAAAKAAAITIMAISAEAPAPPLASWRQCGPQVQATNGQRRAARCPLWILSVSKKPFWNRNHSCLNSYPISAAAAAAGLAHHVARNLLAQLQVWKKLQVWKRVGKMAGVCSRNISVPRKK